MLSSVLNILSLKFGRAKYNSLHSLYRSIAEGFTGRIIPYRSITLRQQLYPIGLLKKSIFRTLVLLKQ